jgi:glycosyltransferase involved in cell wall biosynthesis
MNYLSVVSRCFIDRQGGAPRVAWDIAKLMKEQGHNVYMFCQKANPDDAEFCEYEGIKVVRYQTPLTRTLDPLKFDKKIAQGKKIAQKYLRNIKWDKIHIHLPLEGKIISDTIQGNPEYIYTVHSPAVMEQDIVWGTQGLAGRVKKIFAKRKILDLEGSIIRKANKVHMLSNFTQSKLKEYYDIDGKISIIPHWCRENFKRRYTKKQARKKLKWPEEKRILFTLRHHGPRYGIDVAIKAITPILKKDRDMTFYIGGDGPLKTQYMDLVKKLNITHQIKFLGRISDDELQNCYDASDLFILPTRSLECFGLIVLEAYSYGLPIISTDAGALPELIRPIAPDMIVAANEIESLSRKIEQYFNGNVNVPTSNEIIEYCNKNFGKEVITRKLLRFIMD